MRTLQSPNEEASGLFGGSVSGIPDVNGDGRGDVIVGASEEDPGQSPQDAGRAYIFSGATGARLRTLQSPNEEAGGIFGVRVSGIPDADGDGKGDVIVGAWLEDPGQSPAGAGRAYVFCGATGARLRTLSSSNEETSGHFGYSVSGIPDVNGDGKGDVIVGATQEDPGASPDNAGRAYIREKPGVADCNFNDIIPDYCDTDCGEPGGLCDVEGCGESQDTNGDGIPDECGACCGPEGCIQVVEAGCEAFGKYRGDATTCEAECPVDIPAVSEWGLVVMVLLVVAAATVVIRRARALSA